MYGFEDVTLEFIDKLRNVQNYLKCDSAFSELEDFYIQENSLVTESFYDERKYELKYFYTMIFFLFQFPEQSSDPNFVSLYKSFYINKAKGKGIQLPDIYELTNDCLSQTNQYSSSIRDILTFSFIPSFVDFFLTDYGCKLYIDILKRYKNDTKKFNCLARGVFFSPFFLNFVSNVFLPILSPILDQREPPDQESIISALKRRWNSHLHLLHPIIRDVLNESKNPARTLSESFFEIALTIPTNSRFSYTFANVSLLIDFFQKPTESFLQFLRNFLTYKSKDCVLGDFLFNERLNVKFDFEPITADLTKIFLNVQKTVLSAVDFSVINVRLCNSTFVFQPQFFLAEDVKRCENKDNDPNNATVNAESKKMENALGHLLFLSDKIPVFKEAPSLDIESFILEYLVNRGPLETYSNRCSCNEALSITNFDRIGDLLDKLEAVCIQHKNKTRFPNLNFLQEINTQIQIITSTLKPMSKQLYSLLLYNELKHMLPSTVSDLQIQNQVELNAQFDNFYGSLAPKFKGRQTYLPKVLYSILTENIRFDEYTNQHPELTEVDRKIKGYYREHLSEVLQDKYYGLAKDIKDNEEIMELIKYAVSENSPLRMHNALIEIINKANILLHEIDTGAGEDQRLPFNIAMFAQAAVYMDNIRLGSCYTFLNEFCDNEMSKKVFPQINSLMSPLKVVMNSASK
ncbi:hypothetical protein GPJ56_006605 [Histomonas meleagridis]|uniref:uncharacterized protein n=1 Tax=Histomonas meleagridis TaxID=135588 RepID=UPI00355A3273|nr:hypothetical protein GPJ56_006605 [Histomonas meleagridis]KAH0798437.1 hypothetical protein GO595_008829 [Histomonas meleagridis]